METPTRMIVIDNDEVVLAQIRSRFEPLGYEVITTTTAADCGRYLRNGTIVLIDYHLPGADGSVVVRSLRSATIEAGITCTFYLLTSDRDKVARHAALGFDGAVDKAGSVLISQQIPTTRPPVFRAHR